MSELLKITDISNEIKEAMPEKKRDKFRSVASANNLNKLLIDSGYLYRPAEHEGCRTTEKGRQCGISEETREDYIQILYNAGAQNLVKTIFYNEYRMLRPRSFKPAFEEVYSIETVERPDDYSYSRKFTKKLLAQYPGYIVLLGDDCDFYWAFEDSAELLADALNVDIYKDNKGRPGLKIPIDLLRNVIDSLEYEKANFIIGDSSTLEIHRTSEKLINTHVPAHISAVSSRKSCIKENEFFRLAGPEGEDIYIITELDTVKEYITRDNGTVEEIYVPVVSSTKSNYIKISPESDMGITALGKELNESFECKEVEYTVTGVNIKVND